MDARINELLADIDNINLDNLDEETYEALMKRLEEGAEGDAIELKRIEEEQSVFKEKQKMLEFGIAQGKNRISELEEGIRKREERINKEMIRLAELNEEIKVMTRDIEARDGRIAAREERIAAREERIAAREKSIAARDERIAAREKSIAKDEARLVELEESISARQARNAARDEANARDLARLEKLKKRALELSSEIEQEKIAIAQKNLEIKQSSSIGRPGSNSHTPPGDSGILGSSSEDEYSSVASDLSGGSLSRKSSSSSDELKREKSKRSPSPVSPLPLSSSAKVSASLLPLPASLRPVSKPGHQSSPLLPSQEPPIGDKSPLQQDDELKKQASASKALAFNSPEKDKNLVAKLGLNRDKSLPSSLQQQVAPAAGSSVNVTPVAVIRNGIGSSVH